jgi:ribosomal 50S subunit-recycling heat shock protein
VRLDVFLKRVGLIKQRSLAKDICDRGLVSMDGRTAKAGKEVGPGRLPPGTELQERKRPGLL